MPVTVLRVKHSGPSAEATTLDPERFIESMPEGYRNAFDPTDAAEHAAIVQRRAGAAIHVELWRLLADGTAVLCVVADDRSGLLGQVAATLVRQGLDIKSALIYSRLAPGRRKEAVDFFWVQRPPTLGAGSELDAEDIRRISAVLLDDYVASLPPPDSDSTELEGMEGSTLRVRFEPGSPGEHDALIIDAPDVPGLLLAVVHALVVQRLSIEGSECTSSDGRALDRFVVAAESGEPLSGAQKDAIAQRVERAVSKLMSVTR